MPTGGENDATDSRGRGELDILRVEDSETLAA